MCGEWVGLSPTTFSLFANMNFPIISIEGEFWTALITFAFVFNCNLFERFSPRSQFTSVFLPATIFQIHGQCFIHVCISWQCWRVLKGSFLEKTLGEIPPHRHKTNGTLLKGWQLKSSMKEFFWIFRGGWGEVPVTLVFETFHKYCHQLSLLHPYYVDQFQQFPPKSTILGETNCEKIGTRIVTLWLNLSYLFQFFLTQLFWANHFLKSFFG